jgi:glycosyltransferase involved in cell wall biosynthesis
MSKVCNGTIAAIIFARNEEKYIDKVLEALLNQTIKPCIVVVDDQSTDRTPEIAAEKGAIVIRSKYAHKESWVGEPMLARLPNQALEFIYNKKNIKYFMIIGGDTILTDKQYIYKVVNKMEEERCVIASGVLRGEPIPSIPRGSGRIYDLKWFKETLYLFPEIYGWEAYVVYKALSNGRKVCVVPNAIMEVARPTKLVKHTYGKNMRVLGYHPVYAVLRSLYYMRFDPIEAIKMLYTYLVSYNLKIYDKEVASYLRKYQIKKIKNKLKFLNKIFR